MRDAITVVSDHVAALNAHDIDAVIADYAEDAVLIVAGGVVHGHDELRDAFTKTFEQLPNVVFSGIVMTESGGVVLMQWSMDSDVAQADDGVDTFIVRDDRIVAQTGHVNPTPK
jgi:ketosteroid isomerase-like protein